MSFILLLFNFFRGEQDWQLEAVRSGVVPIVIERSLENAAVEQQAKKPEHTLPTFTLVKILLILQGFHYYIVSKLERQIDNQRANDSEQQNKAFRCPAQISLGFCSSYLSLSNLQSWSCDPKKIIPIMFPKESLQYEHRISHIHI